MQKRPRDSFFCCTAPGSGRDSLHGRHVDVGVIDAVEGVGEDGQRDCQRNFRQLRIAVTRLANRRNIGIGQGAAGLLQLQYKVHQGIALAVPRRSALTYLGQHVGWQPGDFGASIAFLMLAVSSQKI